MRPLVYFLCLTVALPLGACNSRTRMAALPDAATEAPLPPPHISEETKHAALNPPKVKEDVKDAEYMRLAPSAPVDPKIARTEIDYPSTEKPGTIIVSTGERRLYYILDGGRAMRYPVSVGRAGMSWAGTAEIDRKLQWPDWNPPSEMIERMPELPKRVPGGPLNPIGARALYLAEGKKDTMFRIHGTNEPKNIGKAVSSGCIRMLNEDVVDLYDRVPIGTKVIVR